MKWLDFVIVWLAYQSFKIDSSNNHCRTLDMIKQKLYNVCMFIFKNM